MSGIHINLPSFTVLAFLAISAGVGAEEMPSHRLTHETVSRDGSTRATAYACSNKIITARGKVFVACLDRPANIMIRTLDLAGRTWSEPVLIGKGDDNHSGPAITMDSRGYLYVAYGPHNGPMLCRRSSRPYDASEWEALERFAKHATYPSLVCDAKDNLHLVYRGGAMPRKLIYQRRPKGASWQAARVIVDPRVKDGYTHYGGSLAVSADGLIHLAFHIYDVHPPGGNALGYLRSRDEGVTWETAAGESVGLPATPATPCFLEQGTDLDMRLGNVAVDNSGRPWLLVWHNRTKPKSASLWHHDGKSWKAIPLLPEVQKVFPGREIAMQGTLAFDRDGHLYATCVTQPPPGGWGHPSQEVALLTSTDGGGTFHTVRVSGPGGKAASWLVSIERPFGPLPIGAPSILYTHGGPGVGATKGDPTEIVLVTLDTP